MVLERRVLDINVHPQTIAFKLWTHVESPKVLNKIRLSRRGERQGLCDGRMWSLVFLTVAFVLAIFSLFYADWYRENVTGFVVDLTSCEEICSLYSTYEACFDSNYGDNCSECFDSATGACMYSPPSPPVNVGEGTQSGGQTTVVPTYVFAESYKDAYTVKSATDYVLDIAREYVNVKDYSHFTSSTTSDMVSSGSSFVQPVVNFCGKTPRSKNCLYQLTAINNFITSAIDVSIKNYRSVLAYEGTFSSFQISGYADSIRENTVLMEDVLNNLKLQLVETTELIREREERIIEKSVEKSEDIQESKKNLEGYVSKYEDRVPVLSKPVKPGVVAVEQDCVSSVEAILLGDVDTGTLGVNKAQGNLCQISVPKPKLVPGGGGFSTTIVSQGGPPAAINLPPQASPSSGGGNSMAFYVQNLGEGAAYGAPREAFAAALSPEGSFIIGFFSASSNFQLEREIDSFIRRVTLGLYGDFLTGGTISAGIYDELLKREVPWVLWAALIAIGLPFLFFGKYLLPTHSLLISDGRRAVATGDFAKAVGLYKEIVSRYRELRNENGEDIRQDVLEYFIILRSALRARNVKFDINVGVNKFPNIFLKSKDLNKFYTDAQRVEKILHDSLHDLRSGRKRVASLAPMIAEMYSRLDSRDKERLAPLYERFVYSLRNSRD